MNVGKNQMKMTRPSVQNSRNVHGANLLRIAAKIVNDLIGIVTRKFVLHFALESEDPENG